MVFDIDDETRRLVASLPRGDAVEEFDCVVDTCRNPTCRCQRVTLAFRARASGVRAQPVSVPERTVDVDIGTRTIDATFRKSAAQSDIAFGETLLAAMEPADIDLPGRLHFMIKRHETEHTAPAEIHAPFDFDEIERSSMMQTYNDILPFAETMQVAVDGIEYVVLDQYCLKPRCGCTDAYLNLLSIGQEGGMLETTGSVNVNYDGKIWEWVADEPLPCDVTTFRRVMESTIPDLYTKLQARHKKLRAIYFHACKRARTTIADSLFQQSVGRNDPCPCGSGKKFKKCCLGKADPRRTESTITIRR